MGESTGVEGERDEAAALLKVVKDGQRQLRGSLSRGMAEAFALFVAVVLARFVTGNRSENTSPLAFAGMGVLFVLYAAWVARMFLARRDFGLGADRRFLIGLGATAAAAVMAGMVLEGSAFTAASGTVLLAASLTLARVLRQATIAALGGMLALNMMITAAEDPRALLIVPIAWVLLIRYRGRRLFEP